MFAVDSVGIVYCREARDERPLFVDFAAISLATTRPHLVLPAVSRRRTSLATLAMPSRFHRRPVQNIIEESPIGARNHQFLAAPHITTSGVTIRHGNDGACRRHRLVASADSTTPAFYAPKHDNAAASCQNRQQRSSLHQWRAQCARRSGIGDIISQLKQCSSRKFPWRRACRLRLISKFYHNRRSMSRALCYRTRRINRSPLNMSAETRNMREKMMKPSIMNEVISDSN